MKDSRNLARIVTSRRQLQSPLLDLSGGEKAKAKEHRLVTVLAETRDPTRAQLIRHLYDHSSSKNGTAFRQLHKRVFSKLLNHLYFLDHTDPRYSVSRRYQVECLDLLHKSTVLYLEGDHSLATRLGKDCLKLAIQDGFISYAIEVAELLRKIYTETHQVQKYRTVVKELERLQKLRRLEEQAEALYAEVRLSRGGNVSARSNGRAGLKAILDQLRQLHLQAQSPVTADLCYRMQLTYLEQCGDYMGVIEFCQEAGRQLEQRLFNSHRFDVRFNLYMQMYAFLLTQQPEKGLAVAKEAEKHFHPSSVNWLYFEEYRLLLAMHAGQFDLARRIAQNAHLNPVFVRQSIPAQERWELFSVYLNFVLPPAKPNIARRRQLSKLSLLMPEYSRDKRGLNVSILIGQVLYYLQEQNADEVVQRVESLRKYRLRHLREAAHQRTRLFLRLLQLIADEQFDFDRCHERATPLLQQLATTPPPGEVFVDVEIIPYSLLWSIIMKQLRTDPPVLLPPSRRTEASRGGASR